MRRLALLLLVSAAFAQSTPVTTTVTIALNYTDDGSTFWLMTDAITVPPHATSEIRFSGETAVTAEGWITGLANVTLHGRDSHDSITPHVQLVNNSRQDLLCKGRGEVIAQSSSPSWPEKSEYGYHVRAGDQIGIVVWFENPSDQAVQLQRTGVEVKFQAYNSGPFRQDAYPMWFNSRGCGPSDFDLKPGRNISSGTFEIPFDGLLVALQGALRDHGEYLTLDNRSRQAQFLKQEATFDADGRPATRYRISRGQR